jgi:hypothetical protein
VGLVLGQTINRITLFALILSLGLLVDAAIVVMENIHRHLHHGGARNFKEALVAATNEIGNPTNVATIAVILAFIPMAFVSGMMGPFMRPIPFNVPVAMIASLLIAYMVVFAGVGVVEESCRIGNDLADQPALGKQAQGIVDGGLGDARPVAIDLGEHLVGGKVLRAIEQYLGDLHPLRRGRNLTASEGFDHGGPRAHWRFHTFLHDNQYSVFPSSVQPHRGGGRWVRGTYSLGGSTRAAWDTIRGPGPEYRHSLKLYYTRIL